jgi:hypothetical protein
MSQVLVQRCADCDHYIPVDVFKGLCEVNKGTVQIDDPACKECAPVKKCKFCKHYSPKEECLGFCKAEELTYPDLVTRTCEMFEWGHDFPGGDKKLVARDFSDV